MVVEYLTFTVPVDELERWLEIERRHWTRFLEQQTGFVRKEMWQSHDDPNIVHAVIWWESMADWKSIPAADLDRVVADMGVHERTASCMAFEVLRQS